MSSDVIWSNYALIPQDGRDQGPLRAPGCGGSCRSEGDTGWHMRSPRTEEEACRARRCTGGQGCAGGGGGG